MTTTMKRVVGVFESYAQGESAVEDLDVVGLNGEDVILIPGAASDARGRGYIERSRGDLRKHEGLGEKILDAIHRHEKKPALESSWVRVDGQAAMPKNDALDIEDAELTDRDPSLEGFSGNVAGSRSGWARHGAWYVESHARRRQHRPRRARPEIQVARKFERLKFVLRRRPVSRGWWRESAPPVCIIMKRRTTAFVCS